MLLIHGLIIGVIFGFALEKARVFEPAAIIGQMRLKNFLMLKTFLAALIATLAFWQLGHIFESMPVPSPRPLVYGHAIIGGLLLGIGIYLAGACPGTVLVQMGVGYKSALFTFMGGILGALAYGFCETWLAGVLTHGEMGALTLHGILGWPMLWVAVGLMCMCFVIVWGVEKKQSWRLDQAALE